jgi:hypothetical protein
MLKTVYTFIGGNMKIPAQLKEIVIHVHSIDYALKCQICSISEESLKISPISNKVDMFMINDPVVCMYMDDNHLEFKRGDIKAIDPVEKTVELIVIEDEIKEERRIFERYPVSIAVSARRKFSSKRIHLIAKDISEYGMGAISSVDLDVDETIDIDLITGKYMFYFVGKLIWKEKLENGYEYGIQLTHFDVATKSSVEAYLGKLKEEYASLYKKAR